MLQHVSTFSGIDGFALAMQRAGIPTIAACEIDKHAAGVIRDHWPHLPILHDIREVTADALIGLGADPAWTVFSAGWPCQGNSVAGRRRGMDDERSGLWSEVSRILDEFRPAWFVGENVPGLLSVAGGADFATVIGDLARLGYGFAWRILDSQHFGVPQRRRRVALVARLGDDGRAPAQILLEPEGGGWNPAQSITPRPLFAPTARGGAAVGIAGSLDTDQGGSDDNSAQTGHLCVTGHITHALTAEGSDASEDGTGRGSPLITVSTAATLTAGQSSAGISAPGRRQEDDYNLVGFALRGRAEGAVPEVHGDGATVGSLRSAGGGSSCDYIANHVGVRRLTPLEKERLQGYPDSWTLTSNGNPQSDSQRGKQIGNSIAVPVFEWIARRLAAVDEWQRRDLA